MSGQPVGFYEFGPFSIDLSSRVLLRDGKALPLEPKVFDTLLALVENRTRVVSKDELMKAVWGPDTFAGGAYVATPLVVMYAPIVGSATCGRLPQRPTACILWRGYPLK